MCQNGGEGRAEKILGEHLPPCPLTSRAYDPALASFTIFY